MTCRFVPCPSVDRRPLFPFRLQRSRLSFCRGFPPCNSRTTSHSYSTRLHFGHPFVRSPPPPALAYNLLCSSWKTQKVSVLGWSCRSLRKHSATNSSVPARFRTSGKEGASKRLLFPSLPYKLWGFFPLEISRVQSDSFSQTHSKRAWSTAG